MATYKDYITELAPPWLRQVKGETYLRGLADPFDAIAQRHKDGVKQRFPDFASPGALTEIGGERGLPRGPSETDSAYATRLKKAWDVWPYAGTPLGMLTALLAAGYSHVYLITQKGQWHTLDGSAQLVTTQGPELTLSANNFWNSYLVYFYSTLPASWVSGGVPADNSSEANNIRAILEAWAPAHMKREKIVIAQGGPIWGLTMTWGSFTWGGTAPILWSP
jgi:hypothetical protein